MFSSKKRDQAASIGDLSRRSGEVESRSDDKSKKLNQAASIGDLSRRSGEVESQTNDDISLLWLKSTPSERFELIQFQKLQGYPETEKWETMLMHEMGLEHSQEENVLFEFFKTRERKYHFGKVWSVCALDANRFASAGGVLHPEADDKNGTIFTWDLNSVPPLKKLKGHTSHIQSICALDGNRIASGSWDKTIKIWNLENGECINTLSNDSLVSCVCALEGNRIASAGGGNKIKIWDVENGTHKELEGHTDEVTSVCKLDSNRIASGSVDSTKKIWDVNNGTCVRTLKSKDTKRWIQCICALDANRIVSGDQFGLITIESV